MIGNLLRAQDDLVAEEFQIGEDGCSHLGAQRERRSTGKAHAPLTHQVNHRVLDDFGVHFESGDLRVFAECLEHGIGGFAKTGLNGQERARYAACLEFSR